MYTLYQMARQWCLCVAICLFFSSCFRTTTALNVFYVYTDDDTANPFDANSSAQTPTRIPAMYNNIINTLSQQSQDSKYYSLIQAMLSKANCADTSSDAASSILANLPSLSSPNFQWYRVSSSNPQTFSAMYEAYKNASNFAPDVLAGSYLWLSQWIAKNLTSSALAYVYMLPQSLSSKVIAGVLQYLLVSKIEKQNMLSNASTFYALIPGTASQLNSAPGSSYYYSSDQAYIAAYEANFYNSHAGQPSTYYYDGYEYSDDYFYSQSYQLPPQAPVITGSIGSGSSFYLLNATITIVYDDTADLVLVATLVRLFKNSNVPQLNQASVFHIPANYSSLSNFTTYVELLGDTSPLLFLCLVSQQTASTMATAIDQTSTFVPMRYDLSFEFANFSQSTWMFWNTSSVIGDKLAVSPYLLHLELGSFLPDWQTLCPQANVSTFSLNNPPPLSYNQFSECTFTVWLAALTVWNQIYSGCQFSGSSGLSLAKSMPFRVYQPASGLMAYLNLQLYQGFGQYAVQFGSVSNTKGLTLLSNSVNAASKTCRYPQVNRGTNKALQALGRALFPQTSNCYDIVTMNVPPYYFKGSGKAPTFGICADLVSALSSLLGFSYTITATNQLSVDYTLNDSIPYMMINEKVDFAVAPMLLDTASKQWKSFRFTVPFMQVRYSVLSANTTVDTSQQLNSYQIMFAAYFPFESFLWLLIGCTAIAVFIMLAIQDSLLPNKISFSIQSWPRTLHYVFARLVLGVSGTNPDTFSSQILIIFWCLCSLIILFSYLANYSAMIISSNLNSSISTPQELLYSGQAYSTINGSDTLLFFQHSTLPAYQMMYAIIQRNLLSDIPTALQSVLNGQLSLIFHQPTNVLLANMYCLVSQAPFASNDLVMAIPRAQDLFDPVMTEVNLNQAIMQLQVNGYLSNITSSYWLRNLLNSSANIYNLNSTISPYACKGTTEPLYALSTALGETNSPVQLQDLLGPILILLGAIVFTLLIAVVTRVGRIVQYKHATALRLKREKAIARVRQDITRAVNILLGHRTHDKKMRDPKVAAEEVAEQQARKDLVSILKKPMTEVEGKGKEREKEKEGAHEAVQSKSTSFEQHALQIIYEPEVVATENQPMTRSQKAAASHANLMTADVEQAHKRVRLEALGMNEWGEDKHPKAKTQQQ